MSPTCGMTSNTQMFVSVRLPVFFNRNLNSAIAPGASDAVDENVPPVVFGRTSFASVSCAIALTVSCAGFDVTGVVRLPALNVNVLKYCPGGIGGFVPIITSNSIVKYSTVPSHLNGNTGNVQVRFV